MNTSEEKKIPIDLLPCTNPKISLLFWGMIIGILLTIVLEALDVEDGYGLIIPFLTTLCALPGLLFIWNFSKACRVLRHGIANLGYAIVYLGCANLLYDFFFQNADEKSAFIAAAIFLLVFTILSVWGGILMKKNYEGEMGELGDALIKFPFIIILVIIVVLALGAKGSAKWWIKAGIGLIYLCYFLYVKVLKRMYNLLNDGLEMVEREPEVADLFNRDDLKVACIDGEVVYITDSYEEPINYDSQSEEINLENETTIIDDSSVATPLSAKDKVLSLITDDGTKKKKWYYIWGGAAIIAIGLILYLACSGLGKGDPATNAQDPSISTMIKAIQQATGTNAKPVEDMLDAAGYSYRFKTYEPDYGYGKSSIYVYSKNCEVVHEEYRNGLEYTPVPESENASIIILRDIGNNIKDIEVQVYSDAAFITWISQLKTLGYQNTSGATGNCGRDWEYVSKGKPNIRIWNDFSTTYVLTISK